MKKAMIPAEIKMRVQLVVEEGLRKAEKHYGVQLPHPKITYEKSGTVAGTASYSLWTIDLNSVLLMDHVDTFIARTPLHELAHLICFRVYPETWQGRGHTVTRSGRLKREKREVHGPRWQEVAAVIGLDDAKRTHSYDVTNARRHTDMFEYVCTKCQAVLHLTSKRNSMILNGTRKYTHKCGGAIISKERSEHAQQVNQVLAHAASPVAQPVTYAAPRTPIARRGPTGDSKIAKCWGLFNQYVGKSRADMINIFIYEADCTPAGASTYYATCQKLYREGYI